MIQNHFDAASAARALSELRPTTTFLVPAHLQRLFALGALPDTSSLRLVAHAGSACPPPLKRAAIDAFGADRLWEFYGSTEGQFTACSSSEWLARPGTVGRARSGRHLSVDDEGAIWCEVPRYARFEYWRDAEATARSWRPARPGSHAHGAFTVGDLGRLDDDGYLFIDGRRDDLIITGGVNVYPAEIEAVLAALPGVDEVAVFGRDDERWGQRVCAAYTGTATSEELTTAARERLAPFKRPKELTRVDHLPHTATGKIQRLRSPDLLNASL